jgi:hypothetical protein
LNAQAGTPQRSGLVSKYELSFQQFIGEFFGSYRLIEEPRGWLDLLGVDLPSRRQGGFASQQHGNRCGEHPVGGPIRPTGNHTRLADSLGQPKVDNLGRYPAIIFQTHHDISRSDISVDELLFVDRG